MLALVGRELPLPRSEEGGGVAALAINAVLVMAQLPQIDLVPVLGRFDSLTLLELPVSKEPGCLGAALLMSDALQD